MTNVLKAFWKREDGAVTVDWVVLTAAIVGLAIASYTVISTNTQQLSADAGAIVGARDIALTTATGSTTR